MSRHAKPLTTCAFNKNRATEKHWSRISHKLHISFVKFYLHAVILSVITGTLSLYYFLLKDLTFKRHGIRYRTPIPYLGNMGPVVFRRQSISELIKSAYNIHPDAKYVGVYDMATPRIVIRDMKLIKCMHIVYLIVR